MTIEELATEMIKTIKLNECVVRTQRRDTEIFMSLLRSWVEALFEFMMIMIANLLY